MTLSHPHEPAALRSHLYWRGCYRRSRDLATPESTTHPAKMDWTLCERIIAHLEELGLLRRGDTVLDFMAGTGRTALVAGARGYRAVTLELEPRFVAMQRANKAYAERRLGYPLNWTILQGDARRLSDLLQERGLCGVVSPPYINADVDGARKMPPAYFDRVGGVGHTKTVPYGTSLGQIGAMPDRSIGGVTSPPYDGDTGHGGKSTPIDVKKRLGGDQGVYGETQGQLGVETGESYLSAMLQVYRQAAQVCRVLVVVTKNPTRHGKLRRLDLDTAFLLKICHLFEYCWCAREQHDQIEEYLSQMWRENLLLFQVLLQTPNLDDGGASEEVQGNDRQAESIKGQTPPTYQRAESSQLERRAEYRMEATPEKKSRLAKSADEDSCARRFQMSALQGRKLLGSSQEGVASSLRRPEFGQLRNAMSQLSYQGALGNCEKCGKRTPPGKPADIKGGWQLWDYHRSILFEEEHTVDLFGTPHKRPRGRISFFKRLSYQKGAPVARWEDVLFCVRDGDGFAGVVSPPYAEAQTGGGISAAMRREGRYKVTTAMPGSVYQPSEHGDTPGQIGNLKW